MQSPSWSKAWQRWRARLPEGRGLVSGLPLLWLALFFGLPFLIIARISLSEVIIGLPELSTQA